MTTPSADQLAERARQCEAIRAAAVPYLSAEAMAAHLARGEAMARKWSRSIAAAGKCQHRTVIDSDKGPARVTCERCPSRDLFGTIAADQFACDEYAEEGRTDK